MTHTLKAAALITAILFVLLTAVSAVFPVAFNSLTQDDELVDTANWTIEVQAIAERDDRDYLARNGAFTK